MRPLERNDVPYIIETWLGVLEWRVGWLRSASGKAQIRAALHDGSTLVACVHDDTDAILGFATVDSTGATLMAYTRRSARKLGICAELFKHHREAKTSRCESTESSSAPTVA